MNPTGTSQFNQARIEWAIRLRYSPMPELDMGWIASNLNAHRIGEYRVVGKIWEIMMERDAELALNAAKRYADVASLDWQIESDGSPDGDRHAAALKYLYDHCVVTSALDQDEVGGVRKLIRQAMTAISYRHSIHEMLLRIDNPAAREITFEFRHTPVWFFEGRRGYLGYLKHIFDMYGQPCIEGEWLTMVGEGWMRPLSIAYAIKHFPLRDWLLFCTRYGTGFLDAETNAQRGSPEWNMLEEAVQKLANDGVLLHNPLSGEKSGLSLKFLEQSARNQIPMQPLVEYINKLYAKVYRGTDTATGTRGVGDEGGGAGHAIGASVQKEESGIYLADDVFWINEGFHARIDRPAIRYLFDQEPRARFVLMPEADENSAADLNAVKTLVPMGLEISKAEARKRFNWSEPEDGEPILGMAIPVTPNGTNGNDAPDNANGKPAKPFVPSGGAVYIKSAFKSGHGNSAPSVPAQTADPTPIGAGADSARNPELKSEISNFRSRPAPQMPDPQPDNAAFWSRAGLQSDDPARRRPGQGGSPRGPGEERNMMPALGYAVPNVAADAEEQQDKR